MWIKIFCLLIKPAFANSVSCTKTQLFLSGAPKCWNSTVLLNTSAKYNVFIKRSSQNVTIVDLFFQFFSLNSRGQWRSIVLICSQTETEDDHPILRTKSGGCSTIIEEREVSWSQQHPGRTGPSSWRGCHSQQSATRSDRQENG